MFVQKVTPNPKKKILSNINFQFRTLHRGAVLTLNVTMSDGTIVLHLWEDESWVGGRVGGNRFCSVCFFSTFLPLL